MPLAGDLVKAGKIKKDINIIENAVDAVKAKSKVLKAKEKAANDVFHFTGDRVAIPKGEKYKIPDNLVENLNRKGNYGTMENDKYKAKLRIDPATPPGQKGLNVNHYHKTGRVHTILRMVKTLGLIR